MGTCPEERLPGGECLDICGPIIGDGKLLYFVSFPFIIATFVYVASPSPDHRT